MKFLQGVKKRTKHTLVRLCQYDFPDTKCFGCNVLDDKVTINASMEIYCRNVLLDHSQNYAFILHLFALHFICITFPFHLHFG